MSDNSHEGRDGRVRFTQRTTRPIKNFNPNERQVRWLLFLMLHRYASSYYLHEYTKSTHKCPDTSRRMLQQLFDGQFVYKPFEQRNTDYSDGHYHVYALDKAAIRWLKGNDLWVDAKIPKSSSWPHDYFVSCITATIHILCERNGFRYIPLHTLLERAKKNKLTVTVPYTWDDKTLRGDLTPDQFFAIDFGSNSYISFFVEADRYNEGNEVTSHKRKSILKNVRQYHTLLRKQKCPICKGDPERADRCTRNPKCQNGYFRLYQDHYCLTSRLVVLNITVSPTNRDTILSTVNKQIGPCSYMAAGVVPEFGGLWKPPELLTHIFDDELLRNGMPPFVINCP